MVVWVCVPKHHLRSYENYERAFELFEQKSSLNTREADGVRGVVWPQRLNRSAAETDKNTLSYEHLSEKTFHGQK